MENRIITFEANQQCLRKTGGPNIFATKTVSYVEAQFDLGENWSGFDSVSAVWWNDFVKPIPAVLDTEGMGRGNGNTAIGHQSGYRFVANNYNTMIGFNSLGRSTGDYNICIGNNTEFAEGASNSIAIGKAVKTTKSNQMILGSTDITEVVMCGNKKIVFNGDGTVTWEEIS